MIFLFPFLLVLMYKSNQTNSNATLLSAYELNKIFDGSFGGFNDITCTESDDLTDVDEICLFDTNDQYVTSSKLIPIY